MLVWLTTLALGGPETELPVPCSTPVEWKAVASPTWPDLPPPPGDLGIRDAYGVENVETSEHFALWWGPDQPPTSTQRTRLLDAFETSWAMQIGDMGHTAPYGTDAYHFNVYVGDTGGGTRETGRAAGFYSTDPDGWPVIVIGRDTLDRPDYSDITVAHEFYHAVQGATDRYTYNQTDASAWLWEASATWASHEVYPDNPGYAAFLFGYAFHPHLSLDFFDYPNQGVVTEYYQYGAFIFPVHISDRTGSWQVIRDVWMDPGDDPDPLAVMTRRLAEDDLDFDTLWLDHIARNVTWDYPDQEVYRGVLARYGGLPEAKNGDSVVMPSLGRNDWTRGPRDRQPLRYGTNTLVLPRPLPGQYTVEFKGFELGDLGSVAEIGATLVLPGDPVEYRPMGCENNLCTGTWDDLEDVPNAYFALGRWSVERGPDWKKETFPYEYRVTYTSFDVEEPEPTKKGCGCSGVGSPVGWVWLLMVPLWRRRR
ncbi:MAG: DUF6055 domain-containing protein [Myxococcota bacterium]